MASEFQFASVETTPSYSDILDKLERDLRRERPSDVLQFCANYFNGKLAEQREILLSQTNLDPSGKVRALFLLGLTVHVIVWYCIKNKRRESSCWGEYPFGITHWSVLLLCMQSSFAPLQHRCMGRYPDETNQIDIIMTIMPCNSLFL
jgi:hypothetical protein